MMERPFLFNNIFGILPENVHNATHHANEIYRLICGVATRTTN